MKNPTRTVSSKAERYARAMAARMRISGFSNYESERVRSYMENAYMAGYAAKGEIVEDVILKAKAAAQ